MSKSIIINVPLSSPLHPQANLPYLKGFLGDKGFGVDVYDTNIRFFHWLLGDDVYLFDGNECLDNPVSLLIKYNELEDCLSEKTSLYSNLNINLRTMMMGYDRKAFDDVAAAVNDETDNPFYRFFSEFIDSVLKPDSPLLICISITFQDQIIPAFTLASLIRHEMAGVKIVLGGQMITRCYDTLVKSKALEKLWDYLICWEGELPLVSLHERIINKADVHLTNIIENGNGTGMLDRDTCCLDFNDLSSPDFSDIPFGDYIFPEYLVPIQSARGCYGTCEFCAIPSGSNTGFRQRDPEKIIRDIKSIQALTLSKTGKKATCFKLMDDTSSPTTLLRMSELIEKEKLDVIWETFVRMEKPFTDPEFMAQLYRGGCRKLMWGLETNDPNILKKMNKKISAISTSEVLNTAHNAGILNFVFVMLGFPGENKEQRDRLAEYIIETKSIHALTMATFDVTKKSRIEENLTYPNAYGLTCKPATGFEVRLPYLVHGKNIKEESVAELHRILMKIIKKRPDIGFMTLFPDQVRSILSDRHGNTWGEKFLSHFGEQNIIDMLTVSSDYIDGYSSKKDIDLKRLPEPLVREHYRTREDIAAIASAIKRRRMYEDRRANSI